jgi:GNAT superfamily N-acetyltransferase
MGPIYDGLMGRTRYVGADLEELVLMLTGNNIKMNVARLRRECLSENANNPLATAVAPDGRQVGHCLMSHWEDHGDRIWWITQLVVHPEFRNQKVASTVSKIHP